MGIPLFASRVSNKLLPSDWRASIALRCRFASISCWAASHSSLRLVGSSFVPPDTNPEDMLKDRGRVSAVERLRKNES